MPTVSKASKRIAAVTPEPQVVMTGRAKSTSCLREERFDFVRRFDLALRDHLAPRQIETAGNMARAQSGARLGGLAAKPRRGARIENLRRTGFACLPHLFGIGDGGAVEIHGEPAGQGLHGSAVRGGVLRPASAANRRRGF